MAGNNSIDTNPEALRSIASSIETYTSLQYETIREYLNYMSSLEGDITIQNFRNNLEAINEWLNVMDRLRTDGANFAAWLKNKAAALDEIANRT